MLHFFGISDFNFCSFEHCYRLVEHSGCTKAEALEAASSRWNYRKCVPSCVLSKYLISDKIEVPSIFPNSEMVSCISRSFSKAKLFCQACPDLGLGGKKGEFGGEESVLPSLISGFWKSRSIMRKDSNNESFKTICEVKLKSKQIPF